MKQNEWLESPGMLELWKVGFGSINSPAGNPKVIAKRQGNNLWAEYRSPYPEIRLITFSLIKGSSTPCINCRVWFYAEQYSLRERFLHFSPPTLLGKKVTVSKEPLVKANWKAQLNKKGITLKGLQYDIDCRNLIEFSIRASESERRSQIEENILTIGEEFLSWVNSVYQDHSFGNVIGEETAHPLFPNEVNVVDTHLEGASHQVFVNSYERDPKARQACINHYGLLCQVCDIDFENVYGKIGAGFIHVHHEIPLHSLGADYIVNPITDLKPLCPNCHAMVHRTDPPMSVADLRRALRLYARA